MSIDFETTMQPRRLNGQFDYQNMDLICVCGHRLGIHAAVNDTKNRPCFNEDEAGGRTGELCDCENFQNQ